MDQTSPQPGLNEQELLEFLHEITSMDEAISEEEAAVEESELEEQSWFEAIKEEKNKEVKRMIYEPSGERAERTQKMHRERVLLKTRIQRSAFDQSELPLTERLSKDDIKLLIDALTEKQVALVEHYTLYITARIKALLLPFIPGVLRKAYRRFPNALKECPGFLYRTEEDYGNKIFFVKPQIPYFIEQGTEMDFIRSLDESHNVAAIDKAVSNYHQARERLFTKETGIAAAIPRYGLKTYFDLLNHNVVWFSSFYLKKTGKPLKLVD